MNHGSDTTDRQAPPCALYEDDHVLVVHKPAGMNTHAPDRYAGEGLHEWLKHREPRWASLAIVHRLDKGTSGLLVFAKTREANRSLTEQFTEHRIQKTYLLLTDRPLERPTYRIRSCIVRAGSKYRSFPEDYNDALAETRFTRGAPPEVDDSCGSKSFISREVTWIQAAPITGRTHQIRVHAAELGFPILGDAEYGGTKFSRVCLHAFRLELRHPVSGQSLVFEAPPDFARDVSSSLRAAVIDPGMTTAWRLVHGSPDGWPHGYVDKLGDYWLSQSERSLTAGQRRRLHEWHDTSWLNGHAFAPATSSKEKDSAHSSKESEAPFRGLYHKLLRSEVRQTSPTEVSPEHVEGEHAPARFVIIENGIRYELSFEEGYSVGLFLDQRDNRRRLLVDHVAAGFRLFPRPPAECSVLNAFAYTCAFSVCAARAGAVTTSLDLSRKYLDWGRRNFVLNDLRPDDHDFIYGDVFHWLPRLARKGRNFDVILLDPPTFSKSKQSGVFRADKDFPKLIRDTLPMLIPGGTLLASCNTAKLEPAVFVRKCLSAVAAGGRKVVKMHYAPQPPDFPVTREEPAYLKTLWMRIR